MSSLRDRLLAAIAATPPEKRGYSMRNLRGVYGAMQVSFTDLLTDLAPFIEAEIQNAGHDVAYYKRREAAIIAAVGPVCDGGQCVNDIVSAVERMKCERDEAQAEIARLNAEFAQTFGVNVPPLPNDMKA